MYIENLKRSSIFNNCLFILLITMIGIAIPVATLICYSDFRTFKDDTTPAIYKIINKFNLTDIGIEKYFKPDYVIGQLDGWYITHEIAEKFYDCK